jgi:hypothetical protein
LAAGLGCFPTTGFSFLKAATGALYGSFVLNNKIATHKEYSVVLEIQVYIPQ